MAVVSKGRFIERDSMPKELKIAKMFPTIKQMFPTILLSFPTI